MAVLPDETVPPEHRRYAPGRDVLDQPVRQSLPVSELAVLLAPDRIEPGRRIDAMARLEAQLHLRQVDAQQYSDWERRVLSIGTPDALAELDEVRTGFIDVIGTATEPAKWDLEFSGNLPAVTPEASTVHAREVAELDTALLDPQTFVDAGDDHTYPRGRAGETGWREHDAVFGERIDAPLRVTAITRIARFLARLRRSRMTGAR